MTEPIICPPHQRRVVVGDHMVWHEHDAAHCPYPVYVRGSSVLTAEQIRRDERSGAMDRTVRTCGRCGGHDQCVEVAAVGEG